MVIESRRGHRADTADTVAVRDAAAAAVDGVVGEVRWWAHRRLGSHGSDAVVYRVAVVSGDHDALFVVAHGDDYAVFPAEEFDSVPELLEGYLDVTPWSPANFDVSDPD